MSDLHACPREADAACIHAGPLSLKDALDRFRRAAVRGVCDTGRYRCPYFIWGQGPPLVFVHGLSDAARSFLLPMARLADHFRCVGYDLPRGGPDGARLSRYTHAALVEDLFALLDHVGARQAYLLGSSFGSTVVLAAMAARPARVPRAVLQGGFVRRRLAPAEVLLAGLARYWSGTMAALPFREAVLSRGHHGAFAGQGPEVWEHFLTYTGSNPIAAVAHRALMLHRLDLGPVLPQIRQPVLMVGGDIDPVVGKDCEEALAKGLPNVRRVELEGCGHFPHFTHPEPLAELVRQFLTPPCG
jgi:pimeloyl-ACP methyl ester carboxylesterase